MNRNAQYDASLITGLGIKMAWATVELMSDDVKNLQLLVSGSQDDVDDLRISQNNGRLTLEQPAYGLSTRIATERWMQVTLRIPRDWRGEVRASTMTGLMQVRGLAGTDFSLSTVSGTLRVNGLNGMTAVLHTVTGLLDVCGISAEKGSLRTVSGDLSLYRGAFRQLKLTSVSGMVVAGLDEAFDTLDINTVSGAMSVQAPIERARISLRSVTGKLKTEGVENGDGGPVISANSMSGGLTVTRTGVTAADADAFPDKPE